MNAAYLRKRVAIYDELLEMWRAQVGDWPELQLDVSAMEKYRDKVFDVYMTAKGRESRRKRKPKAARSAN